MLYSFPSSRLSLRSLRGWPPAGRMQLHRAPRATQEDFHTRKLNARRTTKQRDQH